MSSPGRSPAAAAAFRADYVKAITQPELPHRKSTTATQAVALQLCRRELVLMRSRYLLIVASIAGILIGVGSTFPAELTAVPSLIFWTVTGIVIGLFADTRKEVLWWGALYGFFLSFSFLFSRFGGTTAQIPRYLALVATASIVSAVCGIVVVYVGWTIHRLFSRSQPTS